MNLFLNVINFHCMSLGAAGSLPEEVIHNMIWNRTINVQGHPHGNIGMDLGSEFHNNFFKS
jgi:hypothetical protein